MLVIRMREYRSKLIRGCKVDWIVKPRVGTYASLEATGATVNLTEQLDLEPAFIMLNSLSRRKWASEFGDPDKANGSN